MATQITIVNAALALIGSQAVITALNDGSPAGNAAGVLYTPTLQFLLRSMDPDFARRTAALVPQANGTDVTTFTNEYQYPSDCLRLRQLQPVIGSYDPNDPQPIRGIVAFDPLTSGGPAKVILCNLASGSAVYTTLNVTEALFDAAFVEEFERRLANPFAMAIAGRPDYARELLEEAERYAGLAELSEEM